MVKFEKMQETDAHIIVDWNKETSEEFLFQWAGKKVYTYPLTQAQIIARIQDPFCDVFKIVDDGKMVGTVEVQAYDEVNKSVRLVRLLIGDGFRAKGYGKKAIEFVETFVKETYSPETLELGVYEFNKSARKLYKKLGYVEIETRIDEENPKWNSYTMAKQFLY